MARFIEEEENDVEAPTEPSSDTKIYTMKSQIGHERTASERLADRVKRNTSATPPEEGFINQNQMGE